MTLTPATIAGLLASSALTAIWQGAVLVAAVLLALRLLPGLGAGRRAAVWVAALALLAALQLSGLTAFLHHGPVLPGGTPRATWLLDPRWSFLVAGLSLFLSVFGAVRLLQTLLLVRGIRRRATPAGLTTGHAAASILESPEVTRPCVVGFLRPAILLPHGLLAQLSQEELEQVLLHESAHIRRGDPWINLLQKLALVLFPLNPALFFAERQLSLEREMACDDHVLHRTGTRKAYAACLARLAEHRLLGQGATLLVGAWGRRPELVRRVERILRGTPDELGGWRARTAAAAVMLAATAGGAALSRSPELVGFRQPVAPEAAQASSIAPSLPERYGTVQMVKAVLPSSPAAKRLVRSRRLRVRAVHRQIRPSLLMANAPAPPATSFSVREIAWQQDNGFAGQNTEPVVLSAMLYLVPTTRGWLVIQI